jgi:hypothetical protein
MSGGILSLESIPGLHKRLKIRALDLVPCEVGFVDHALPIVHAGHDVVNDVKTTVARHMVQLAHNSPISRDDCLLQ